MKKQSRVLAMLLMIALLLVQMPWGNKSAMANDPGNGGSIGGENVECTAEFAWSYDGQPHGVVVTVTKPSNGATIMYKEEGGEFGPDCPTITNVNEGPKTIIYRVTAEGYNEKSESVLLNINPIDPEIPTGRTATYGQTLADVSLPDDWSWVDSTTSVGNAGENSFKANYNSPDPNHKDKQDVDITVDVQKVKATVTTPPTGNELSYDNTEQALVSGGVADTSLEYSMDNLYTWSDQVPKREDIGTYKVYYRAKADQNHDEGDVGWVTAKIIGEIQAEVSRSTWDYDGNGHGIEINVNAPSTGAVIEYKESEEEEYGSDCPTITNVSESPKTIHYKITAENYYDKTGSATVKIDPADPETPTDLTATYGQKLAEVQLPDGWTWQNRNEGVGDFGNNTFKADYAHIDDNHKDKTDVDLTVNVRKAKASVTTPPTGNELPYNGEEQALVTADGVVSDTPLEYSMNSMDESSWSDDVPQRKNADTYTVYYRAKEDANHDPGEIGSVTATINKKTLSIKAKDHTITYGDAPTNNGVEYEGFIEGESESDLSGTLAYDCNYGQFHNVGEYTITPKGYTSGNYDISYLPGILTVEQKEVGLNWSTAPLTFNGQAQAPEATATGMVNGDEITVVVSGKEINAGDGYTGTASDLSGDKKGNYKLPADHVQTFSIAKAAAQTIPDVTKNVTYTITEVSASLAGLMPSNAGEVRYSKGSGSTSTKVTSWDVDPATGAVTATLTGGVVGDNITLPFIISSRNYGDSTVNVKITLEPKSDAGVSITGDNPRTVTFGSEGFQVETAVQHPGDNGSWKWESNNTAVAEVSSTGVITIKGGGDATIKASYESDSTIGSASLVLHVNARTPAVVTNLPAAKEGLVYNGSAQELITAGTASGGTLKYAATVSDSAPGDDEYSESIPSKENALSYHVWYKAFGDSGHDDSDPASVVETISKKPVTLSNMSASKTYDGSAKATLSADISGVEGKDNLSITADASFDDPNVGSGKTVKYSGLTLGGNAAGNYTYNGETSGMVKADITKRPLTITARDQEVKVDKKINTDTYYVYVSNMVDGHVLSSITLKSSSTEKTTDHGTITPSNAVIKSGNADVTGNYAIYYIDGRLTVKKKSSSDSDSDSSSSSGGNSSSGDGTVGGVNYNELRGKLQAAVLQIAAQKAANGGAAVQPQVVTWDKGEALPYDVMKTLQDNPDITLVFKTKYGGVNYVFTIPGSAVKANPLIPWYGPLYLLTFYGQYAVADPAANSPLSALAALAQLNQANAQLNQANGASGLYVVKRGDTLSKIARMYNTTAANLALINGIKNPNKIYPGQILQYTANASAPVPANTAAAADASAAGSTVNKNSNISNTGNSSTGNSNSGNSNTGSSDSGNSSTSSSSSTKNNNTNSSSSAKSGTAKEEKSGNDETKKNTENTSSESSSSVETSKDSTSATVTETSYEVNNGGTTTDSSENDGIGVWVSDDGNRYHKEKTCSGMTNNVREVTIGEAKEMGKTACGKCHPPS